MLKVAIRCTATWDGDATFTYLGESAVLSDKRSNADDKGYTVVDPQESFNFADHCFGTWQVDKCMDVEVTYEFDITNTYTIPQALFYDKRENQNLQVTVKNSKDGETFKNNYGSLLDETHNSIIQPKQTQRIFPRGEDSEKQTFTINTCDEGGMNFADFRIKMTLGIFCNYDEGTCNHGNNGNLANRCKSMNCDIHDFYHRLLILSLYQAEPQIPFHLCMLLPQQQHRLLLPISLKLLIVLNQSSLRLQDLSSIKQ